MNHGQVARRENRLGQRANTKLTAFLSAVCLWSTVFLWGAALIGSAAFFGCTEAAAVEVTTYSQLENYTQDTTTSNISFGANILTGTDWSSLQFGASKTIDLSSYQFGNADAKGLRLETDNTNTKITIKENSGNGGFLYKQIYVPYESEGSVLTLQGLRIARQDFELDSDIDTVMDGVTLTLTGTEAYLDLYGDGNLTFSRFFRDHTPEKLRPGIIL